MDWDDDDEDEKTEKFFDDITRVLVPVFVALWWQWVREKKEMIDDDDIPALFEAPDYISY
jgi:hypothetical protein